MVLLLETLVLGWNVSILRSFGVLDCDHRVFLLHLAQCFITCRFWPQHVHSQYADKSFWSLWQHCGETVKARFPLLFPVLLCLQFPTTGCHGDVVNELQMQGIQAKQRNRESSRPTDPSLWVSSAFLLNSIFTLGNPLPYVLLLTNLVSIMMCLLHLYLCPLLDSQKLLSQLSFAS